MTERRESGDITVAQGSAEPHGLALLRRGLAVIGRGLSGLGRHGPPLLVLSLIVGWIAPELSRAVRPLLPLAAFLLVLGSFWSAAIARHDTCRMSALVLSAVAFAALAPPMVVSCMLRLLPFEPEIELAALLAALAPPTGSLAAVAAMLALRPRFALVLMLALTVVAPLSMPLLMGLFGIGAAQIWTPMALRLSLIVGAAALLALPPVCRRLERARLLPEVGAAVGVSVIGLVLVGIATAGAVAELAQAPGRLAAWMGLALGLNLGLTLLGLALFIKAGVATALTAGLAAGNRNVTLVWAAGAGVLPMAAQTYLALCVATILMLPLALKGALAAQAWALRMRQRPA